MTRHRLLKPLAVRVRAALVGGLALLEDVVGLAGYGLVVGGVFVLWGKGWAMIAAGVPLATFYVWRSLWATRRGDSA